MKDTVQELASDSFRRSDKDLSARAPQNSIPKNRTEPMLPEMPEMPLPAEFNGPKNQDQNIRLEVLQKLWLEDALGCCRYPALTLVQVTDSAVMRCGAPAGLRVFWKKGKDPQFGMLSVTSSG